MHQGLLILHNMLSPSSQFKSITNNALLKEFHLHHKKLWKLIAFKQDGILSAQGQDLGCNLSQFVCFLGTLLHVLDLDFGNA
jgi:hypothetical protein